MYYALMLTTLAGLSTGLGGLLGLWRRPGPRATAASMGFAAGVMLLVSLGDMLPGALENFTGRMAPLTAGAAAASLVAAGMATALLFGRLLPEPKQAMAQGAFTRSEALHCALTVGVALLLHNLPEGVLTLFAGVQSPRLGLRMTLAVALHNIPEGLSVAVPLYYATGSRWKSALAAFLSGLAEPLGGLLAFALVGDALTQNFLQGLLLLIAGVMCCVSVEELLPAGFAMAEKRWTVLGFILGTLVMLVGIAVLA